MRVKNVLTNRHRTVLRLTGRHTVADAVEKMTATVAGALIVTSGERPAGMFTRSDVMRASADSPGKSFSAILLREAMIADPVSVDQQDDIAGAIDVMLRAGIDYLPVLEDGRPIAVLSIHDLVTHHVRDLKTELEQLNDYINQLHDCYQD